jgi:hypothetical protein
MEQAFFVEPAKNQRSGGRRFWKQILPSSLAAMQGFSFLDNYKDL